MTTLLANTVVVLVVAIALLSFARRVRSWIASASGRSTGPACGGCHGSCAVDGAPGGSARPLPRPCDGTAAPTTSR